MRSRRLREHALLFEEFLARESKRGRLQLTFDRCAGKRVLLHGHCHQKAFDAMSAVEQALRLVPGLAVETDRLELLRHGGRLRLRSRALRRVDAHGRGEPAAERAQSAARYD